MSDGPICPCVHGCRQYALDGGPCPQCLGGWHSSTCLEFTAELVNGRLQGIGLPEHFCGRCGAQRAAHP